jgi:pimeloyl-ACP methyl ester carboxylesterase
MQAVDLDGLKRRSEAEAQLIDKIPDVPTRKFLLQNLVMVKHRLKWRINLDAIGHAMSTLTDFPDEARHEYEGRVLFISGEKSDYIAREHHDAIFALFPQAEFAVIANAGHRVHAEQPGAFLTRVLDFLESGYA